MAANSGQPGPSVSFQPLIGGDGMDFVLQELSNPNHPKMQISFVQSKCALQHPLCEPLMGMVDQLGLARLDAHKAVLQMAKTQLLTRLRGSPSKVQLERLLQASFAYLGLHELRDIPLSVMDKLESVPPVFLKQLTMDKQIFKDLPAKVQRQVWEFDKNLLQQDALPLVGQYKYEVATIMRALAMDEFLPSLLHKSGQDEDAAAVLAVASSGPRKDAASSSTAASSAAVAKRPSGITRKILRKGSRVLQALKDMVGTSPKIYNQVVELCVVKFRDSDSLYVGFKEQSYCTLRSQLLMALHDDNNAVAARDKCHELAWTLDAGIMNGGLTDKHLLKIEKYFEQVDAQERQGQRKGGGSRGAKGAVQDEAESAGNASGSVVEPFKVLGDAGVILRDPSVMHLLLTKALALLEDATIEGKLPRDHIQLCFVLRLIHLAVDCRQMLRDRKYRLPDPDTKVMSDVLPALGALMYEFKMRKSPAATELTQDPEFGLGNSVLQRLVDALPRSEVARKLCQVFVLERMYRQDYLSAARVLQVIAQTLAPKGVYEVADFAASLALRLSDLVKAHKLPPTSALWRFSVDNVLVRAVDCHTQVHEEVLRLLLAAAKLLQPDEMGKYLQLTLDHSKRSRKRMKKQHVSDPLADFPMALSDVGSDIGSDGWPGIMALKIKGTDGVRSVYDRFRQVPGVSEASAPALFAYLAEEKAAAGRPGAR